MKNHILFITPDSKYLFYNLCTLNINKIKYLKNKNKLFIPKKWQLILMSDGSFTQNLHSFIGSNIYINISQALNYILINKKK